MNTVRALRKTNKQLEKKLQKENKLLYNNMILYLQSSHLYEEKLEEIKQDLLGMFIDAQLHGEAVHTRIGYDTKAFCNEIMENSPKKTTTERVLTIAKYIAFFLFVFFIGISIVTPTIHKNIVSLLQGGTLETLIPIRMTSILNFLIMTFVVGFFNLYLLRKRILNKGSDERQNTRSNLALCCGLSTGILVGLSNIFLDYKIYVSFFIILFLFILSLIVMISTCSINIYLRNKHIKMTEMV